MLEKNTKSALEKEFSANQNKLAKATLDQYQQVVQQAAKLARIDHDINNPLTIISLSISRITMAGKKHQDEKLIKYAKQMEIALANIHEILQRVEDLKNLDLIKEQRRIDDEEAYTNS